MIRKDPRNVRNRYYRFRLPIDLASALLSGVLVTTGSFLVGLLYDVRYSEAGPMLQILAIGMAMYPLQIIRNAFAATGDSRTVAFGTVVQALSLIVCMMIGYVTFGTIGSIAGVAIHRLFPSAVIMFLAHERRLDRRLAGAPDYSHVRLRSCYWRRCAYGCKNYRHYGNQPFLVVEQST